MFEKILFPIDFSDGTTEALKYIKQLKECGTEEVVLLAIVEDNYLDTLADNPKLVEKLIEESIKEAKKNLEIVALGLLNQGFKVKAKIATGISWKKILDETQKENISLIIIGSYGKNIIKRLLWRAVSKVVIKKSSQPVLVIPKNSCATDQKKLEILPTKILELQ